VSILYTYKHKTA